MVTSNDVMKLVDGVSSVDRSLVRLRGLVADRLSPDSCQAAILKRFVADIRGALNCDLLWLCGRLLARLDQTSGKQAHLVCQDRFEQLVCDSAIDADGNLSMFRLVDLVSATVATLRQISSMEDIEDRERFRELQAISDSSWSLAGRVSREFALYLVGFERSLVSESEIASVWRLSTAPAKREVTSSKY